MRFTGQHLLIDADDTLWENNIYFERAFHRFCDFLAHSSLTREQVRTALDEIELVNIRLHGYGAANFGRNMVECYHHLVEREIQSEDAEFITGIAREIMAHPLEIIDQVPETLAYLAGRHDLLLVTKGNEEEQRNKVEASGLGIYFREIVVLREKDVSSYGRVVREQTLSIERSWMIGNSPKSDINPALAAGLQAVYVPHPRTWHLEKEPVPDQPGLLQVEDFCRLRDYF
ncbi:MAG: HAD family hydrolase [Bryobacterales bacterium]|nr:HAD family hydrolase [Bryobacterales bacterium]